MKKVVISALSWMLISSSHAGPFYKLMENKSQFEHRPSDSELLKESQISYRAEGGFTGVESYGVIISCVKGKISVMKSIHDPRLKNEAARVRQLGNMNQNDYLRLWGDLQRQAFFKMRDSNPLTMDINDEFTNYFIAKVGGKSHKFEVVGISRPEASRYYALRERIDQSVNMKSLWSSHENLARHFDSTQNRASR